MSGVIQKALCQVSALVSADDIPSFQLSLSFLSSRHCGLCCPAEWLSPAGIHVCSEEYSAHMFWDLFLGQAQTICWCVLYNLSLVVIVKFTDV